MKKLISFVIALSVFCTAFAQDSSQALIQLPVKTKFALDMWPANPTIKDFYVLDTLRKAIAGGSNYDSVTFVKFKAGTILNLAKGLMFKDVGGYYIDGPEFFTAPLGPGFVGLLIAVDYYIGLGAGNPNYIAAKWLKPRLDAAIAAQAKARNDNRANSLAASQLQQTFN